MEKIMALDAKITASRQVGANLFIRVVPAAWGQWQKANELEFVIRNFTHFPLVGQLIWGVRNLIVIEPGMGMIQAQSYIQVSDFELSENGNALNHAL